MNFTIRHVHLRMTLNQALSTNDMRYIIGWCIAALASVPVVRANTQALKPEADLVNEILRRCRRVPAWLEVVNDPHALPDIPEEHRELHDSLMKALLDQDVDRLRGLCLSVLSRLYNPDHPLTAPDPVRAARVNYILRLARQSQDQLKALTTEN